MINFSVSENINKILESCKASEMILCLCCSFLLIFLHHMIFLLELSYHVISDFLYIRSVYIFSLLLVPSGTSDKNWNDTEVLLVGLSLSLEVDFTKSQVIAAIPGAFFCAWYASKKHWLADNILGLAFSIQGIEMLSIGSFKTGGILLAGLFVYNDRFWVFFTPVMVSIAKSFDAPIKLLFPTADAVRPFSMLGLGDIVIPGIFVALALRFDVSRGKQSQYFKSAFVGYIVGVVLTIVVMNWFQAAQPALLYIVPSVIGFLAAHCLWNGEVKALLEFDESKTTGSEETDADLIKKEE
ncbi:hypothetical protein ACJIZ3_014348 [Penstemon smallii]|uniref:Uncharacterized protein n=1 Tax=Penstemon smallii TaxID=265156 RepID=A0ABD3RJB8_9LAMI